MSQITITLPDGAQRQYDAPITGAAIATSIAPSLAKKAIAVKINGVLSDLDLPINDNATLHIITRESPEALELIRHDAAHVMAEAVQNLFPGTQVTIGPAIDNGFYYDFYRETPFTTDDLASIEAEMKKIIARGDNFIREVWSREQAIAHFKNAGEKFKVELIEGLPGTEDIKIYKQGTWLDLCRGPHMPTTKHVGDAFKLMSVAGAYWRGDHRNAQLQRIYGTAWREQKELDGYLHMLAEAEARDHRKLGKELHLFHMQEEAVGNVFWHPKGWVIWQQLENFIRRRLHDNGYHEVRTPQLLDRKLWEESGHWEKFRDNMFTIKDADDKELALKPMNCPAHVQIFKQGLKSYRDLPLRLSEFGCCHRNEPSGALHGIMRVRAFTQDDAHIFCTPEQVTDEALKYCELQFGVYRDLGFDKINVKLALRPETRAGTDEVWDRAEQGLRDALNQAGIVFEELPGEGAFYGPKVEFHLTDAIGRTWQCGTLQLDFVLPERLDANYIGEDGAKHRPVMLHRALLGSMERFIGMLIEHYAGKFPLWLSPVQVVVASVTGVANDYAENVVAQLHAAGLRAECDVRNEKINYKIREHSLQKTPIIAVVGAKEAEEQTLTLRRLGSDAQETIALDAFIKAVLIESKAP